jgi:hypothetical protein
MKKNEREIAFDELIHQWLDSKSPDQLDDACQLLDDMGVVEGAHKHQIRALFNAFKSDYPNLKADTAAANFLSDLKQGCRSQFTETQINNCLAGLFSQKKSTDFRAPLEAARITLQLRTDYFHFKQLGKMLESEIGKMKAGLPDFTKKEAIFKCLTSELLASLTVLDGAFNPNLHYPIDLRVKLIGIASGQFNARWNDAVIKASTSMQSSEFSFKNAMLPLFNRIIHWINNVIKAWAAFRKLDKVNIIEDCQRYKNQAQTLWETNTTPTIAQQKGEVTDVCSPIINTYRKPK